MRIPRCLGAVAPMLLACACAGAMRPSPTTSTSVSEGTLDALAVVLRGEDRRMVDDAVRATLDHPDPAVRRRAALALARIAPPDGLELLTPLLEDDDASVRAEAAFALGLLGDPLAGQLLAESVIDPAPEVRASVAQALGQLAHEDGAQPLEVLLGDADPRVTAAASLVASRMPDPVFAIARLLELTESEDLPTVFGATYSLARLASEGAPGSAAGAAATRIDGAEQRRIRARLAAMAAHPSAEVRIQVARGLVVPFRSDEQAVVSALLQDGDVRVRVQAAKALSYPGAPVEPLLSRAARDRFPQVAAAAYEALGVSGRTEARSLLLDGIGRHRPDWVRVVAIRSLGRVDPSAVRSLAPRFLLEDDPRIGEAALHSLSGRDDPDSLEIFREALGSRRPAIRAAAVLALAVAGEPVPSSFADAASSPHAEVRAAVARAAGARLGSISAESGERDALVGLLADLWRRSADDPGGAARRAILDAAAVAGARPEVRTLFDAGLDDPDRRVRYRAARHLNRLFGENADERLAAPFGDDLADYRRIAAWARRPRAAIVTVVREGFVPARFTLALEVGDAPLTSWRFAQLAEDGFYDGLAFDRLVPGFVLQTADALESAPDQAGVVLRGEPGRPRFAAGTLGMSAEGDASFGNEWFVTFSAQPHLDGRFTAFGRVVQNFPGVVLLVEPGDRIVSVEIYEGDGTEPLPALDDTPNG